MTTIVNAALVAENGIVFGTTLIDLSESYNPPPGLTVYQLDEGSFVGPGWQLVDGMFTPPSGEPSGPPLPTVTELEAKYAELNAVVEELLIAQLMEEGLL